MASALSMRLGTSSQVKAANLEERKNALTADLPVPVARRTRSIAARVNIGDPVDKREAGFRIGRSDGIRAKFTIRVAGHDH